MKRPWKHDSPFTNQRYGFPWLPSGAGICPSTAALVRLLDFATMHCRKTQKLDAAIVPRPKIKTCVFWLAGTPPPRLPRARARLLGKLDLNGYSAAQWTLGRKRGPNPPFCWLLDFQPRNRHPSHFESEKNRGTTGLGVPHSHGTQLWGPFPPCHE